MKERGQVIVVNCKRCGREMPKWELLIKREVTHPFPFDSICGFCITPEEVARHYPNSRGVYLKSNK
jgi:ribosomal protein S26